MFCYRGRFTFSSAYSPGFFRWADIYNNGLFSKLSLMLFRFSAAHLVHVECLKSFFLHGQGVEEIWRTYLSRRKHLDWMFDRWNQEWCLLFDLQGSSLPLVIHLISQGPDTGWAQGGVAHFSHLDGRRFEASRRWRRGFWRLSQNLQHKSKNWRQFNT